MEIPGGNILFHDGGLLRSSVFRLIKAQRLNDNIIGQAILIAGIDGRGSRNCRGARGRDLCGGGLRGKQGGVALVMANCVLEKVFGNSLMAPGIRAGMNDNIQIADTLNRSADIMIAIGKGHLVPHLIAKLACQLHTLPLDRLMGKTVQLLQPEGTENGGNGIPGQSQLCAEFVLDFHRHTHGRGKIVRYVPGLQRYRLGAAGKGKGQPLGNFPVILARAQPAGNVALVPLCHQMGGQHFPKIIVDAAHIGRQIAGNPTIPRILVKQPLKVFFTLGAEKGG